MQYKKDLDWKGITDILLVYCKSVLIQKQRKPGWSSAIKTFTLSNPTSGLGGEMSFSPIWRNIFYFKKNTLLFHRSTTLQGRKYSSISEERNSKRKKGATVYLERTLIFSDLLFQCFPVFLPLFQRFLVFSVLCPHVFTVVYALPSALHFSALYK